MKRRFLVILLTGVLVLGLTGCSSKKDVLDDDVFPTDRDILPGDVNYYYTFAGESEHYIFEDGMADYRDDKAYFWIQDFKLIEDKEFYGSISIYVNDRLMSSVEYLNNDLITKFKVLTKGNKINRDKDGNFYGEINQFMLTNPDDLEKALKITGTYCDTNNKCNDEEFKLTFIKHEDKMRLFIEKSL